MQKGFTVVEIIIVTALSLLLITALLRFIVTGYPLSKITFLQASANETARIQLKRIVWALRGVRESDAGAYPIVEMRDQRIIFYANIDDDSATERVRYELIGNNLERGIIDPSGDPVEYNVDDEVVSVVASSIRNGSLPVFLYYTGNYPDDAVALSPMDVTEAKYIEFTLLVDADDRQSPLPIEVLSQVQLRNLKTNLGEIAG